MRITKYPQACFLIEHQGQRILIDPGVYVYDQMDMKPVDFKGIDLILLTHKDKDHTDPDSLQLVVENNKCPIWCNREVHEKLLESDIPSEVMEYDQVKVFNGIEVRALKSIHGKKPTKDDLPMVTGFLIDDKVYHPGDTLYLDEKPYADVVLVPICGTVVMNPEEAGQFVEDIKPKLVIPMHYDSPRFPGDPKDFEKVMVNSNLNIKVLEFGESIEI